MLCEQDAFLAVSISFCTPDQKGKVFFFFFSFLSLMKLPGRVEGRLLWILEPVLQKVKVDFETIVPLL